jgi:hypothetical protein
VAVADRSEEIDGTGMNSTSWRRKTSSASRKRSGVFTGQLSDAVCKTL